MTAKFIASENVGTLRYCLIALVEPHSLSFLSRVEHEKKVYHQDAWILKVFRRRD